MRRAAALTAIAGLSLAAAAAEASALRVRFLENAGVEVTVPLGGRP